MEDLNHNKIVELICWKLLLEKSDSSHPEEKEKKRKWNRFKNSTDYQKLFPQIIENIVIIFHKEISRILEYQENNKQEDNHDIWTSFTHFLHQLENPGSLNINAVNEVKITAKEKLKEEIKKAINNALGEIELQAIENTISSSENTLKQQDIDIPQPIAKWEYKPIPKEEPEPYEEYICKSSDNLPEKLKLFGARVRGKGHKHQGTNCDDWFEFDVSGDWTIIAVSDGAGSRKFSRIGAKVSCEAAVKSLKEKLKNHKIIERNTKQDLQTALHRDKEWFFTEEDIKEVQNALYNGIQTASEYVENAFQEGKDKEEYKKILNRELEIKDFAATLLLAIHTTIKADGKSYNLVFTCQVGDGMLAAVSKAGKLQLLGKPDSGEFAGQTDFLTSKEKLKKKNLVQKMSLFVGDLKALMVMTDGVADDYFPNDPGMLELYGDLVLNQIIDIPKHDEKMINEELIKKEYQLLSLDAVKDGKNKFYSEEERIIDPNKTDEPKKVLIASIGDYAKELGKEVQDVVTNEILLAAIGQLKQQMCKECKNMKPEKKLQLWLDSYRRRRSFDDRTLVVLFQEELN